MRLWVSLHPNWTSMREDGAEERAEATAHDSAHAEPGQAHQHPIRALQAIALDSATRHPDAAAARKRSAPPAAMIAAVVTVPVTCPFLLEIFCSHRE